MKLSKAIEEATKRVNNVLLLHGLLLQGQDARSLIEGAIAGAFVDYQQSVLEKMDKAMVVGEASWKALGTDYWAELERHRDHDL